MSAQAMTVRGVFVPIVTPLTDQEELDRPALRRMVEYLLGAGVHGVFVLGSTGEFAALDDVTREAAVRGVVQTVAGRVPVLAGISAPGTKLALGYLRMAEACGVDAVVLCPGYYYPQDGGEVELHVRAIAAAASVPVLLYNIPQRAGVPIPASTVARLAADGVVAGIKDSSGDVGYFGELLDLRCQYPQLAVLQGEESLLMASLAMGADGIVPGIGNLAPRLCVRLYEAVGRGAYDDANDAQTALRRLGAVFRLGSPYGGLKEALAQMGLCGPRACMPGRIPTEGERDAIARLLADARLHPYEEGR
jgi:4-hydroxy-tetrahydrodipicolinate synthase